MEGVGKSITKQKQIFKRVLEHPGTGLDYRHSDHSLVIVLTT